MASIASPRPMPASGASTPTASSRRTSLDTNRTASPARGGTLSTPTSTTGGGGRRNRTALRDYYNLKPPPHSSASGTSPARASSIAEETSSTGSIPDDDNESLPGAGGVPTTELDTPGFDPSAYVSRTLDTQGLPGVLRAAGSLVNEIRELDGERKALVYDNYSKLIAATDTIRGMRANITNSTSVLASHGGQVSPANLAGISSVAASSYAAASTTGGPEAGKPVTEELKRLVELVATIAQELAGTAAEKKEEVRDGVEEDKKQQEREKKERARQTVRWVVESPARFRLYVSKGEVDKARQEWKDVSRLLDKWEGTEGVVEVRKGCLEVLDGADENEDESDEVEGGEEDSEVEEDDATKSATGKTAPSKGDD